MAAVINNEICTGCGRCIEYCPVGAITLYELTKKAAVDAALCIACGICIDKCKKGAISIELSGSRAGDGFSGNNRMDSRSRRGPGPGMGAGSGWPGKDCGGGGRKSGTSVKGECLCLQCGTVIPHAAGVPCNGIPCPKCGSMMVRK